MQFFNVTVKLGGMRKAAEFTIYPVKPGQDVMIQSDKRIATVNLATGKTLLSDGKGGHPGFWKLSPSRGAITVDMPPDVLEQLKSQVALMEAQRVADGAEPGTAVISFAS